MFSSTEIFDTFQACPTNSKECYYFCHNSTLRIFSFPSRILEYSRKKLICQCLFSKHFFGTECLENHNRYSAILLYNFGYLKSLYYALLLNLTVLSLFSVFVFSFSGLWFCPCFGFSFVWCSCLFQNEVLMVAEIALVFTANWCFKFWFLHLPMSLVFISYVMIPISYSPRFFLSPFIFTM